MQVSQRLNGPPVAMSKLSHRLSGGCRWDPGHSYSQATVLLSFMARPINPPVTIQVMNGERHVGFRKYRAS